MEYKRDDYKEGLNFATPSTTQQNNSVLEEKERQSSNFQSFMNTVKLFFGNAYLSIPNTFVFAGLIGGILMFSLVGALNCYTMIQILKVAERHPSIGSYSQMSLKVFGKKGKIVVDVSIWIMQLSVCISYLFFIGQQLWQVIKD